MNGNKVTELIHQLKELDIIVKIEPDNVKNNTYHYQITEIIGENIVQWEEIENILLKTKQHYECNCIISKTNKNHY